MGACCSLCGQTKSSKEILIKPKRRTIVLKLPEQTYQPIDEPELPKWFNEGSFKAT